MQFVAPEKATGTPEIIPNNSFWPDIDLATFRSVMRVDGTVTPQRLKQVVLTAMAEVNPGLAEHGPILPHGLEVELPDSAPAATSQTVQLAIDHLDQTNESDASFLMRLARQSGALACVKNGSLLFIRQGQGKTASGKVLPVITLQRRDGDSHRFSLADRDAYTGVIASWLHTREPVKKEVTKVKRRRKTTAKKKEPEAKQGDYLIGTDENVLVLSRTYASRANAERAAKMQWERVQRGVATFSIELARGRAELYTEMPVKVSGFKQQIDAADWIITTLTHNLGDSGFTTSIELEVKIDGIEME